jgi:hypothetical protein
MRETIRRELRVAFSRRAQPAWFRVVKWTIIILLMIAFWRKPVFWWGMLAALFIALSIHILYRWKTVGWTRPWGGWDDLEAGK